MREALLGIAVSALLLGGSVAPATAAVEACATGHIAIALTGFDSPDQHRHFYHAVEGTNADVYAAFEGDDCSNSAVWAQWGASDGTARSGEDYTPPSGGTAYLCDINHGATCGKNSDQAFVQIHDDGVEAPAVVETARIFLHSAQGGRLSAVSSAPLYIVDADGSQRIAFAETTFSQSESYTNVQLMIYRAGVVSGNATVNVAATSSGASPATAGADFTAPAAVTFTGDERWKVVTFSINNDRDLENDETLTLTLSGPGVVEPSSATFTIVDNEEFAPPQSRLHHPRNGKKYKRSDYRLRELHVFTTDQGGSKVTRAQLGLRKNYKNGDCAWWTGKGWKNGGCSLRQWVDLKPSQSQADFFIYALRALKPSIGTKIESYTAFSRAIDGAGNVESKFDRGRNENTFEVKRGKR